jgi:hypothetical protein
MRTHDWWWPALVLGIGLALGATADLLTHSVGNGLTVVGVFIGGALSMEASIWWDSRKALTEERRVLDSVRRSMLRELQVNQPPPTLLDAIISGRVPLLTLSTPITRIAHFEEAMQIVASSPESEDLYTWMIEVDKGLAHLAYVNTITPLLRASPWGTAGVNIAEFESGHPSADAAAQWRQYKILVWIEIEKEGARSRLHSAIHQCVPLLTSLLSQRYKVAAFTAPPELPTAPYESPLDDLWQVMEQNPYDWNVIKDTAKCIKDGWSHSTSAI